MACCNNRAEDREVPDGVDPCCNIRGRRCLCLPYDDPYMITAQILSIIATFVSWVFWATWLVSIIGMVIFQVLWCTRMGSGALYAPAAIAGATSLGSLAVAIYVLVEWRTVVRCYPFELSSNNYDWRDDDQYKWPNRDYCTEKAWFGVAFACFVLWAAVAGCTFWFVKSGRHARWEAAHTPSKADETEMVEQQPPQQPQEAVVADVAVVECEKEDSVDGDNV